MGDAFSWALGALLVPVAIGAVLAIRNSGIGYGVRSVRCPHQDTRATISVVSRIKISRGIHVERDSLLPGGPVTCAKSCLAQWQ